jgi:hypothetical protein
VCKNGSGSAAFTTAAKPAASTPEPSLRAIYRARRCAHIDRQVVSVDLRAGDIDLWEDVKISTVAVVADEVGPAIASVFEPDVDVSYRDRPASMRATRQPALAPAAVSVPRFSAQPNVAVMHLDPSGDPFSISRGAAGRKISRNQVCRACRECGFGSVPATSTATTSREVDRRMEV